MRLITQVGIVGTVAAAIIGVITDAQPALFIAGIVGLFTVVEYLAGPKPTTTTPAAQPELAPAPPLVQLGPEPAPAPKRVAKPKAEKPAPKAVAKPATKPAKMTAVKKPTAPKTGAKRTTKK